MERNPSSWQMCRNWAVAMVELGGPANSLAATDTCIERFGREHFEKNRAVALFDLGRADEAVLWMRQALDHNPSDNNVPAELLQRATEPARAVR
jgi:truncated hemoglobin YjbI